MQILVEGREGAGNTKRGKYHCTVDLLFDWFGISCMTTDNFNFYLQNILMQTSQTGGQWYNDTSPYTIPCREYFDFSVCTCRAPMHPVRYCPTVVAQW